MKQIFHHYQKWEDFKNGMWRKVSPEDEVSMLAEAKAFTGDHTKYGLAMMRVIREWPLTCEHNLTDNSINQKAFIGHCAVTLQLGIPEYITRMAWGMLTEEQQTKANERAQHAIDTWKLDFNSKKLRCAQEIIRF